MQSERPADTAEATAAAEAHAAPRRGLIGAPRFVHVGYARTGSTLLQTAVFPKLFPLLEARGIACESDEGLVGDFDADNLLLPTILRHASPRTRVLLVIRAQDSIIPSLYSNYVKSGGRKRFHLFLARQVQNRRFFYFDLISQFFAVLGRDNVRVQLFEQLRDNPLQAVNDIARFAGLEDEIDWDLPAAAVNVRPNHHDIEARRLANVLFRPDYRGLPGLAGTPARPLHHGVQQVLSIGLKASAASLGRPRDPSRQEAVRGFIVEKYGRQNRLLSELLDVDLRDYGYPT